MANYSWLKTGYPRVGPNKKLHQLLFRRTWNYLAYVSYQMIDNQLLETLDNGGTGFTRRENPVFLYFF